jgi:hypothetical protein
LLSIRRNTYAEYRYCALPRFAYRTIPRATKKTLPDLPGWPRSFRFSTDEEEAADEGHFQAAEQLYRSPTLF